VSLIRDFFHVMQREKAAIGLFISLDEPTAPMLTEAGTAGFYESPLSHKPIARMQLRTVGQLLRGEEFDIPRMAELTSIKRAPSATSQDAQGELSM
jgi:site-specific DNA-methyltransferase (adenine-specific)